MFPQNPYFEVLILSTCERGLTGNRASLGNQVKMKPLGSALTHYGCIALKGGMWTDTQPRGTHPVKTGAMLSQVKPLAEAGESPDIHLPWCPHGPADT